MQFYRTCKLAVWALRRNILRAALTTLGIVIGIAAVIAMMEIGHGSALAIQRTIASMGANNLLVMPGTAASGGVTFGAGSKMTLTPQDADAIEQECPAVGSVAPVVRARTQVVYGNRNWVPLYIYGTTPAFLPVRNWTDMAAGDSFTERDVRSYNQVCLIGQTLVRELFGGQSPVGKEIRVQNVSFKIIGVLQNKGANMMGMDQDDILLAPWTTIKYRVVGASLTNQNQSSATSQSSTSSDQTSAQVNTLSQIYPNTQQNLYPAPSATQQADTPQPVRFVNVDQILVAARASEQIPAAIQQVTDLLRERHHIRPGEPDDFIVRDMTEITNTVSSTTALMTKLLLGVAMISLVVGGVGIMNIMLVSVTERTREIGLRMAVGAEPGDILRQFLSEAVVLCLIGGVAGIVLGRGSSYLVTLLLHWPTAVSVEAIVAAVVVSATVGILFGYYPAWKASRLDPIEALRYE
jgi:ABC-type antimicrobial peptide transport system permease subunit